MKKTKRFLVLFFFSLVATVASLLVNITPASASDIDCRDTYSANGWSVYPCIYNGGELGSPPYGTVQAYARVWSHPSNCTYYRVYIVDQNRVERFSTSPVPCGQVYSRHVEVWDGEFGGLRVFARFKAYSGSNVQNLTQILSIDSPSIPSQG